MSFIDNILKAFVGDKSQKDVKSIQPLVNKVKTFEKSLMALSNDELRNKTLSLSRRLKKQEPIKIRKLLL